ncbi:hypothetical protein MNBD_BACTEROID06-1303 [hydrothermal vent metagenome]|uniref:DUF4296 domain-containing protein n=1 Tax=hydrothermal vent metagenome TaxID=652676 RepID=A0A3B0V972_9ZZZZ
MACGQSNKHGKIMTHEQMVNYLIQLHIAEAQVQNLRLKKDSSMIVFDIYEKYLLEKNELSDTLFVNSYNYYLKNPIELETIYEAVVDSISVRKSKEDVLK